MASDDGLAAQVSRPPARSWLDVARRLRRRSREVPESTMVEFVFASWLRVKKQYQTIVRVITEEKPKIEKTLECGQCVSPGVSPFPRDRPPALRRLGVTKRSPGRSRRHPREAPLEKWACCVSSPAAASAAEKCPCAAKLLPRRCRFAELLPRGKIRSPRRCRFRPRPRPIFES